MLVQLYNLHQGVHVEYVMFAIHSSVTDTWPMCVNATPRAAAGLEQLFKVTPEVMALTLQAFVTSGIEGESVELVTVDMVSDLKFQLL